MKQAFDAVRQLAKMAVESDATKDDLTRIADTLRDFLDVTRVHFVYAEDRDWAACGDSQSGDDVGTGRTGLWLVQQQAQIHGGLVAFNMRDRRVEDLTSDPQAEGRQYIALKIPTLESPAEMLIMQGPWENGIDAQVLKFLDLALPPLTFFMERMLNASRGCREREQLKTLANAAAVLTQSEDTESVLEDLATAISSCIDYEAVTLDLWDEASEKFTVRAMNRFRWQDTSLGHEWQDLMASIAYVPALEAIRTRQTFLSLDLQNQELIPEVARKFFRWAMLRSGAEIPITFGDEALGTMGLASFRVRAFPPEEVEFLEGIAAQVAVALKARQMYKALAESEKQLREYSEKLQESMEVQHRLARTDALTGIPNRRYVEEVVEGECARAVRHDTHLSVAMVDMDMFKGVNDRYGHNAGDDALVQLARLARRSCRRGDVVGRYGGDEFLFILPETDLRAARRFGERFRSKVEKQKFYVSSRRSIKMRTSLGVATFDTSSGEKVADLIARADAALYEAKSAGGNTTCPRIAADVAA